MDELVQIKAQIEALQKQAELIANEQKQSVIDQIKSQIKLYAISARELGYSEKVPTSNAGGRAVVAPKYRLGDHSWTGRGRQPKWVEDYIHSGKNLNDIKI